MTWVCVAATHLFKGLRQQLKINLFVRKSFQKILGEFFRRNLFIREMLCNVMGKGDNYVTTKLTKDTRSMTRLGDLLHFGQFFKACGGDNYFAQIAHIFKKFCKGVKNFHSSKILFG